MRSMTLGGRLVALGSLAAALVATACTSEAPRSRSEPAPSIGPSPGGARSAWLNALADIEPDGTFSKDAALRMFQVAFGRMPGAPAPSGTRGPIPSGSLALRAVAAHLAELTPAQRARLAEVTARPDGSAGATISVPFVAGRRAAAPRPVPSVSQEQRNLIQAKARQLRQEIAARLGGDIPGPLTIVFDPGDKIDPRYGPLAGQASPSYDSAGQYTGCDLHLYPATFTADSNSDATLAHEMIHCFQAGIYGTAAAFNDAPSWAIEGSAEWGSAMLVGPDILDAGLWPLYLSTPTRPLFQREYDAIGFYAHLQETGHSPWAKFREMWQTRGNAAQYAVIGGGDADFLDSWASSLTRESAFGSAWDTTGPGITSTSAPRTRLVIGSAPSAVSAKPYTEQIYALAASTDLIDVAITGHGRIGDGTVDDVEPSAKTYCLRDDQCRCPDGSTPEDATPLAPTGALLTLTGGPAGARGSVTGRDLECAAKGSGATWHLDSASSYSAGPSHTVVDAYTCGSLRGPWLATVHVTHDPATSSDPPLDVTVKTSWTFDAHGDATPTVGPYHDTVYGTQHTITYYPVLQLDQAAGTITVVSLEATEDTSQRIDVGSELARLAEPVPVSAGRPPHC